MRKLLSLAFLLPLALGAAEPSGPNFRLLPLDARTGEALMDIKPAELSVKLDGVARKVTQVEAPKADVPVRWVLLFEPIREARYRGLAFLAAAEFLRQLPEGDEVLLMVREKESYRALGTRFSLNKEALAKQFLSLPERLPEFLNSPCKGEFPTIEGGAAEPAGNVAAGTKAFEAIIQQISANPVKFAKGLVERATNSGVNSSALASAVEIVRVEMTKTFPTLVDRLAALPGEKHLVVFSRNEADDLARPEALNPKWTKVQTKPDPRLLGEARNAANYQDTTNDNLTLAAREIMTSRETLKQRVGVHDLMIHSVAGAGQNIIGFLGEVAQVTGGQAFTFINGMEERVPGMLFAYRNCVQVTLEGARSTKPVSLDLESSRSNLKLFFPKFR